MYHQTLRPNLLIKHLWMYNTLGREKFTELDTKTNMGKLLCYVWPVTNCCLHTENMSQGKGRPFIKRPTAAAAAKPGAVCTTTNAAPELRGAALCSVLKTTVDGNAAAYAASTTRQNAAAALALCGGNGGNTRESQAHLCSVCDGHRVTESTEFWTENYLLSSLTRIAALVASIRRYNTRLQIQEYE